MISACLPKPHGLRHSSPFTPKKECRLTLVSSGADESCNSYILTRTHVQLLHDLDRRAKAPAAECDVPLAEITRRGVDIFLAR